MKKKVDLGVGNCLKQMHLCILVVETTHFAAFLVKVDKLLSL